MSPMMMRQFWSLIETTSIPLMLDDNNLAQWLLRRIRSERSLDSKETDLLSAYIRDRLPLIRDLAQEYQFSPQG
ncbi:MAG: hypothetical protein HC769_29210 [Cyanobacteria bacterium CRU_2_1]|nr:hypothetical protein [Cyanobacteria bacterium CRU_2_1]